MNINVQDFLLAKSDYQKNSNSNDIELNTFWGNENLLLMKEIISNSTSSTDAIESIQQTFLFQINSNVHSEESVTWLLNLLKKENNY